MKIVSMDIRIKKRPKDKHSRNIKLLWISDILSCVYWDISKHATTHNEQKQHTKTQKEPKQYTTTRYFCLVFIRCVLFRVVVSCLSRCA